MMDIALSVWTTGSYAFGEGILLDIGKTTSAFEVTAQASMNEKTSNFMLAQRRHKQR